MLTVSLLVCAMIALARADDAPAAPSCPEGFEEYKGHCYHYHPGQKDWTDAEKNCQSMNANLASVHTEEEHDFIKGMITALTAGSPNTWIGGTDCQQQDSWLWSNGKAFTFSNWCEGAPDNEGGNQCCTEMNFGVGKCWNDIDCSSKLPSLCAITLK